MDRWMHGWMDGSIDRLIIQKDVNYA